jgi:hypothetical protein
MTVSSPLDQSQLAQLQAKTGQTYTCTLLMKTEHTMSHLEVLKPFEAVKPLPTWISQL